MFCFYSVVSKVAYKQRFANNPQRHFKNIDFDLKKHIFEAHETLVNNKSSKKLLEKRLTAEKATYVL